MDSLWFELIYFCQLNLTEKHTVLGERRQKLFEQHARLEQQQYDLEEQRTRLEWQQEALENQRARLKQQNSKGELYGSLTITPSPGRVLAF